MLKSKFPEFFEVLERHPGLQRKDWEANQSGVDRGIEAVLIQRATRELATYALCRLKFAAMPSLLDRCTVESSSVTDVDALVKWGARQGSGAGMLAKVAGGTQEPAERLAALASLRYYHCRDTANHAVKEALTDEGLKRLDSVDPRAFDGYPTKGPIWQNKFNVMKSLVRHVLATDFTAMRDDVVVASLRLVDGVGEQTASMVALFWLQRPIPIVDTYLCRLLVKHGLVSNDLSPASARLDLRQALIAGASAYAFDHPEWPAWRSLSCLYLWACEIGRLHCTCDDGPDPRCPVRRAVTGDRPV